jgi:hypothetical protein
MRLQQVHGRHDDVVEVERVCLFEPALIEHIGLGDRALLRTLGPLDELLGLDQLVLQVGHLGGQAPRRVTLGVEVELARDELHQPARVVGVVDREGALQPGVRVLGAQDAHTRRVERGHPHQPRPRADQLGHPLLHLTGGLVGERDRDDLAGVHVALAQQVGDPMRQHTGLARPGTGDDQQRRPGMRDGVTLRSVEPGEQRLGVEPAGRLFLLDGGHAEGQLGVFRDRSHGGVKSMPGLRQTSSPCGQAVISKQ